MGLFVVVAALKIWFIWQLSLVSSGTATIRRLFPVIRCHWPALQEGTCTHTHAPTRIQKHELPLNPFNLPASVTSPLIEILTLLRELKVKGWPLLHPSSAGLNKRKPLWGEVILLMLQYPAIKLNVNTLHISCLFRFKKKCNCKCICTCLHTVFIIQGICHAHWGRLQSVLITILLWRQTRLWNLFTAPLAGLQEPRTN